MASLFKKPVFCISWFASESTKKSEVEKYQQFLPNVETLEIVEEGMILPMEVLRDKYKD